MIVSNYRKYIQSQANEFNENITLEKVNNGLNRKLEELNPINTLEYISKTYTGIWNKVEDIVINEKFSNSKWSNNIFLPFTYWLPITLDIKYPNWHKNYKEKYMPNWGIDYISISAIGTWRYTKGIYKLDDEIANYFFIDDSDIKIPSKLLENQPEWSIYVDTRNLDISLDGERVIGFWSCIDCYPSSNQPYSNLKALSIIPLFSNRLGYMLSASIPLDENKFLSIEQSTNDLLNHIPKNFAVDDKRDSDDLKELICFKKKVTQILLFIIQPEPDITEHDQPIESTIVNPYPKIIKGKYRLYEAKKPRYFNVGTQAGKNLKQAFATYKATGKKQAPHIRKAHWHGYWKGSKKLEKQEFFYKWIPPVLVNSYLEEEKN